MNSIQRIGVVTVLGLGLLGGCGKSSSNGNGASTQADAPIITKETDPNSNPAARAAHDFLGAVLKGNTQAASALLTPAATQRIIASGKQFSPPGLETATFRIGAVVAPSVDMAIVQCELTDTSEGTPRREEMACLLRNINGSWLVFGIAYGAAPGKPGILTNFETGQNSPVSPNVMSNQMAGNQGNGDQPGAPGIQANAGAPPVTPPAALPPVGPANVNSPNPATAGLGMPAIGAPASSPQPQVPYQQSPYQAAPYTAQEQQPAERR
jgi:hypothetical protein